MKFRRIFFRLSLPVIAAAFAIACSKDEPHRLTPAYINIPYTVTGVSTLNKAEFLDSLKASFSDESDAADFARTVPDNMTFESYNITYDGKDEKNADVKLSGIVIIPKVGGKFTASGIVISNRATQLSNDGVPSNKWNAGTIMAADNYVLVSCDLIGFGASAGKPANYSCWHLAGRNTLLTAIIAQEMIHDSNYVSEKVNGNLNVINIGYSQGGYSALAVHRYWETEASEAEKTMAPLVKSYCGAGPYSLVAMMEKHFGQGRSMFAPYLVEALLSILVYHPDVFQGKKIEDFLTEEAILSGLVDMLDEKKSGNLPMIAYCLLAFADEQTIETSDIDLRRVFAEGMFDKDSQIYRILNNALEIECVYKDWTPSQKPIWFYHAENDDCVPCECTVRAVKEFAASGMVEVEYDRQEAMLGLHLVAEKKFNKRLATEFLKSSAPYAF